MEGEGDLSLSYFCSVLNYCCNCMWVELMLQVPKLYVCCFHMLLFLLLVEYAAFGICWFHMLLMLLLVVYAATKCCCSVKVSLLKKFKFSDTY